MTEREKSLWKLTNDILDDLKGYIVKSLLDNDQYLTEVEEIEQLPEYTEKEALMEAMGFIQAHLSTWHNINLEITDENGARHWKLAEPKGDETK